MQELISEGWSSQRPRFGHAVIMVAISSNQPWGLRSSVTNMIYGSNVSDTSALLSIGSFLTNFSQFSTNFHPTWTKWNHMKSFSTTWKQGHFVFFTLRYYWGSNCIHSSMSANCTAAGRCSTSFPSGPSWSATFDRELMRSMAGVVGRETRAFFNMKNFTDNGKTLRDTSWRFFLIIYVASFRFPIVRSWVSYDITVYYTGFPWSNHLNHGSSAKATNPTSHDWVIY